MLHFKQEFLARFSNSLNKIVNMESRNENNNKRRRRNIQRQPVLVRSVKPGQASVQSWERKTSVSNLWNIGTSAA
jgi:hypothetical protein